MGVLTGVGPLFRLALRRDRIKLPVWILVVAGSAFGTIPATLDVYAGNVAQQQLYAHTTASSIISRIFGGPIHGPEIGEIVMNETFLTIAVLVAFMSTLAIVRHTRQNEETGRSELISSGVVGRHASLSAALLLILLANIIAGLLVALAFRSNGLPLAGSLAVGGSLVGIGMVFAAIAAITSQVAESARGANALAGAALGVLFMLRAIGDGLGTLTPNGMGIQSAWPSWLSPIGWAEQIYPYSMQRWWLLGVFGVAVVVLATVAYVLNAIRDQGLGMLPARRGPASASSFLTGPLGLAWRLQRGTLMGWTVGILIMGATVGLVAEEFKDLFKDNPQIVEALGGDAGGDITNALFTGMFAFMAMAIAGYTLQALLRVRAEEVAGRLEPLLAKSVSRTRWLWSHLFCVALGAIFLCALLGFTSAISYVLVTHASWSQVPGITTAAMVHIPAILVAGGLCYLVFGLWPRMVAAISWAVLGASIFMFQFATVVKMPHWLMNLSPFTHTPPALGHALALKPLAILLVIAIALFAVGFASFRQRDLATS